MQRLRTDPEYYLQVVKDGEEPKWPKDEADLIIGSQVISPDYIQYWAYPKDAGLKKTDMPQAEKLAAQNHTTVPAILIYQEENNEVGLVLIKSGHAWSKVDLNLQNLEENVNSLVDFGQKQYGFKIEHFLTADNVSKEVEDKLDNLEGDSNRDESSTDSHPDVPQVVEIEDEPAGSVEKKVETAEPEESETAVSDVTDADMDKNHIRHEEEDEMPIKSNTTFSSNVRPPRRHDSASTTSKLVTLVLAIILVGLVTSAIFFRHHILAFISSGTLPSFMSGDNITPTPTPTTEKATPTPTPTPQALDRSQYKIRILNGTSTAGAAGKLSDTLKGLGWQIESVGNASDTNTAQTTIRVKQGMDNLAQQLMTDLSGTYDATYSADLTSAESAKFDVEIIIGKK